jgi:hypothetical protein
MIPIKVHNIVDYVAAAALIVCPYIFGFSDVPAARDLFIVLGLALAAYSAVTQYRYSLAKVIPLGVHMFLDVVVGFVLMIGPYSFNYRALISDGQTALHFILGLSLWALVALTRPQSAEMSEITDINDFKKAA